MDKDKRIYYRVENVWINGVAVHGLQKDKLQISTEFVLEQCFCSCPWPLDNMKDEYEWSFPYICGFQAAQPKTWIEVHGDQCPNAKKGRFLRYVTAEETERYKALGR